MKKISNFEIDDKVIYIGDSKSEIKNVVWNVKKISTNGNIIELEKRGRIMKNSQVFYRLATEQEIKKDKLKYLFDLVG